MLNKIIIEIDGSYLSKNFKRSYYLKFINNKYYLMKTSKEATKFDSEEIAEEYLRNFMLDEKIKKLDYNLIKTEE